MGMADTAFVDDAALAEADHAMRALAAAYPAYAEAELEELASALDGVGRGTCSREALFLPAHNLKGQGGAFGYDLITKFGEALCDLTRGAAPPTSTETALIAQLIGACRTVLQNRMTGDGGIAGRRLVAALALR